MAKEDRFNIRVTPEQRDLITRGAQEAKKSITRFLLDLGLAEARRILGDPETHGGKQISRLVDTSEPVQVDPEKVQQWAAQERLPVRAREAKPEPELYQRRFVDETEEYYDGEKWVEVGY